jgi:tRNA threonylcarbamoyladenosine biosynthesis protein TsaE
METHVTADAQETAKIAAALAERMKGGEVLALVGDLGAGKTTFAQAFAAALGVDEHVQSPTFIFMHEHGIRPGADGRAPRVRYFVHADAYRGGAPELRNIGIQEYFGRPDAVVLIEWADRVEALLPEGAIRVRLEHLGGDRRRITVEA